MLNSARNAIVNLAIFFSCLLVSLFIGEFGIRSLYGNRSKQPEHPLITEYDAVLGWRKIANVTGRHATSEYAISESMNSRGIRGPEYSYEKRHDEYRILVLGDSFAEGYTVEFDQLFSEILKYQLNSNTSGRYYEVINTGTGGYSTDQEFLLFANEGTKYSPDLTILLFHDNDVWYNSQPRYWRGYKPLFRLSEDGTLRLTNVPVPKVDPVLRHDATKGAFWKNPLRATTTWLYEKSYIYRLVTDRRIRVLLWRLVKKIGLVRNDDTAPIPDEFRVYQKQENSSVARAWKTTEALLRKLRGEVNSGGSNFLIFYVPTPAGVYQDDWQKKKKGYGLVEEQWSIEQVRDHLVVVCQRNHFDCVDPLAAFRLEANRLWSVGKRLYFVKDNHWNADGHRLAGEMLAHHIARVYIPRRLVGR